jgi:serine phosphatase RsbU (regulator of sigma subunit)
MMSDGLVENKSSDGKSLSDKKLRQIIVKKNLELLMQEAEKIWHQTPAQDDVTALLLEWV